MAQRYWVVGGEYRDCCFDKLVPGTEKIQGPYETELRARMAWQRLTYRDHCAATERYSIAIEPEIAAAAH